VRKSRATEFCSAAPNTCGSSVCNLLHSTRLGSRVWRWLLDFCKICVHLCSWMLRATWRFASHEMEMGSLPQSWLKVGPSDWACASSRTAEPDFLKLNVEENISTFMSRSFNDYCTWTSTCIHGRIVSWNQLPAGLLASFPCTLNTFRKRVKIVVTSEGIQVNKWGDVKCSDVNWRDLCEVILFWSEVKWSGVTVKSLGIKVPNTLGWPYCEGTWLYFDYFIRVYLVLCLF